MNNFIVKSLNRFKQQNNVIMLLRFKNVKHLIKCEKKKSGKAQPGY